jgi:hypothetical protein
MQQCPRSRTWLAGTAIVSLILAACGEGGNDDSSTSQSQSSTPPPNATSAAPVTASPPNTAPVIDGDPAPTATQGESYSFLPTATDADDDALVFSITNRPAWAAFDTATGQLTGIPVLGSYSNIIITVSDSLEAVSLAPFTITVQASASANSPPTISGAPAKTARQGQRYTFAPVAADSDGNPLTFSITNRPSWAIFSPTSGRLTGTPGAASVRTYENIVIRVTDGQASASLPAFSITVAPGGASPAPNTPPTISGSPPRSVVAGAMYSFRPTAYDANGDTLTFAASGLPSWASINSSSGRISGTPSLANVGSSGDIVISVSDGMATSSLASFTIVVVNVAIGTATLTWTPPTQNADGSPLTDLAGYKVYWGTSEDDYTNSITLDNPGLSSYVVEQLTPAVWFFATTAVNSKGLESGYSNVATKTVQ